MCIIRVLHEHCKNAICIEDFISGIKLTLEDLLSHKDLGYADSMSNVLIKNLEKDIDYLIAGKELE